MEIDYDILIKTYNSLNYAEIYDIFKDVWSFLSNDEEKLLQSFFGMASVKGIHLDYLERMVNIAIFDYKDKKSNMSPSKLYKTYLEFKSEFNDEQRLYLECYFFKTKDKRELKEKYPNTTYLHKGYWLINRLEKYYYNLVNFWENSFTKEDYLAVKERYGDKLTDSRKELLDLYYGVNDNPLTIKEIAEKYGMDYKVMRDQISDAYEYAIRLLTMGSFSLEIDKKTYSKYLSDDYDFTPETRQVLNYYLVDDLSYREIEKLTGLNTTKISNLVTDGIRRIDFYRYNMIEKVLISKEDFYEVCQMFKTKLTRQDIDLCYDRYVLGIANIDVAAKYNLDKCAVNNVLKKFINLYYIFKTKNTTLNKEEIIEEVKKVKFETILSLEEKIYLSLLYGISNEFNLEGKEFTKETIAEILGMNLKQCDKLYNKAIFNIKLRKEGVLKPSLVYLTRDELKRIINDVHLPITEKEKDIICYLFELNYYPYKNFVELGALYGEGDKSIKRRYQRAILTIYKYLNKEVESRIDYESDILPIERYFGLQDRVYLADYYRDKMSYRDIAKKHKLSEATATNNMYRIRSQVYYFLNNKKTKKFDFDYYMKVVDKEDLPFYRNKELAKQVFDLLFGMNGRERLSSIEAIKELNLDLQQSATLNLVKDLMLSVCKYRDGFRKKKTFNYEEVRNFYLANKDNILPYRMIYYDRYFKRCKVQNTSDEQANLSYIIIQDILKATNSNYFDVRKASRDEVLTIIKKYENRMSLNIQNELMARFQIPFRVLMNGKDINHVWRILDKLEQKKLELGQDTKKLKKEY